MYRFSLQERTCRRPVTPSTNSMHSRGGGGGGGDGGAGAGGQKGGGSARAFRAGAMVEVCSDTGDDGPFVGAWLPAVVVSATPSGWSRSKRPPRLGKAPSPIVTSVYTGRQGVKGPYLQLAGSGRGSAEFKWAGSLIGFGRSRQRHYTSIAPSSSGHLTSLKATFAPTPPTPAICHAKTRAIATAAAIPPGSCIGPLARFGYGLF